VIPLHDDNPTTIQPVLTVALIAACALAFFWQLSLSQDRLGVVFRALGVTPAVLTGHAALPAELQLLPSPATLLSSMFLHGGWMHLIGNMLYLWIFGNNVEDAMGHVRFLLFYVVTGVAAALAHVALNTDSMAPTIGASGAISGVLGAYLLLHPHARVLVLIPLGFFTRLIRLPAMYVLGFWFVFQLINAALVGGKGTGVAWGAHIGGFLAGMVLVGFFKRRGVPLMPRH